jgi:hypothetical protein
LFEAVTEYHKGGDKTFGAYLDKDRPIFLAKEFDGLLKNSPYLMEYVPEFHHYLNNYPNAELPGAVDFLYWSKVQFGLRPTVRVSHVVIYPLDTGTAVIGSKMLYASHYFHTALELRILKPDAQGYYLVSINRSRSDGLTGLFGGVVRRKAQSEALEGLESFLEMGKKMLGDKSRPTS